MLTPPPSLPCMQTPVGCVDTLTYGVTLLKVTDYKQMVYRNKVYRVIILHIAYSFWGLRPQISTVPQTPDLPLHPLLLNSR